MSITSFDLQVLVTAQVQIIASKTQARLTKCENYSFHAIQNPESSESEKEEWLTKLAISRYAADFLARMKANPSLKNEIGGVKWEVRVLDVQYE